MDAQQIQPDAVPIRTMRDEAIDDVLREEASEELNELRSRRILSCPDCKAPNFSSVSRLKSASPSLHKYSFELRKNSKHRNTHKLPYECLADGCDKRFAQRQALDRHTQIKHGDTNWPTKYYHCTVDGCKYASTGRRKKHFARADQVKEHMKNYGHYGPHSANERRRRPENAQPINGMIKAVFEEWTLERSEEGNATPRPRRDIQSCEYDPRKIAKLWHGDDTAELYLRGESVEDAVFEGGLWHQCLVAGCYYQVPSPGGLGVTVFKTATGLLEHRRRAHEISDHNVSPTSPVQSQNSAESGSTWDPMDFTDMSTWHTTYSSESGRPLFEDREVRFEVEEELLGSSQHPSHNWEATDARPPDDSTSHSPISDSAMAPLPPQPTAFPPMIRSNSWISMSYFDSGDSGSFISPLSTIRPSLVRRRSADPTTGRLKCELSGCCVTFQRRGDMLRHVNSVHRQSTPHTCSICKRQFRRRDKVRDHLQNVHRISRDADSMQLEALISTEGALTGGGDVVPRNTMLRDGMGGKGWVAGSIGRFHASESVSPETLFLSALFVRGYTS